MAAYRVYQLEKSLKSISQGHDESITSYYNKFKVLWDEYISHVANIQQHDSVIKFLVGLHESYASIRNQLLLQSPLPSLAETYSLLLQEEESFGDPVFEELIEDEFCECVPISSILSRSDKGVGQRVRIGGWVESGHTAGKGAFAFLKVNDGSCPATLQIIVNAELRDLKELIARGTSVHVEGLLQLPPESSKESVELEVEKVIAVGIVMDPATYPLPKTKSTLESVRDDVHLRARATKISSIIRIRTQLTIATHTFFNKHGFQHMPSPIITTSDCEGAGEMFQVTTLFSEAERLEKELKVNPPPSEADLEAAQLAVKENGEAVALLKKSATASKEVIAAAVSKLTLAKNSFSKLSQRDKLGERFRVGGGIPKRDDGKIDFAQDFFSRPAYLTVSGQLHVETYACAVKKAYTFGPTFRAENSHTSRHLAEFWMVEPEMAFADIKCAMKCATKLVKFLCEWLLEKCKEDLKKVDANAMSRLKKIVDSTFNEITYTQAIEILQEAAAKGKKFENKVEWGIDLSSEHERYLTEEKFDGPVIVYNYPKEIKAFYMKVNEDGKTVAAMDVLVPKVGELIGGSEREEDYEKLKQRILEAGLSVEAYKWYLDLRKYGTVKHCGFGMGVERMVQFATGVDNIRDVNPFPRCPGRADL